MTTDEEIKKKLTDQLYWDTRVDASDIDIDVNGSSVTLSGKVP
ncbi:BON domain-containing protein, partial [Candidatus Heimdallarchaeota archaeon]